MARLTGKVALITGAAGGQGAAEAELFVREEGSVVLTDIDAGAGEGLAQRLGLQGGKVLFLRQDVADEASWKETLSAALAHFANIATRQGVTLHFDPVKEQFVENGSANNLLRRTYREGLGSCTRLGKKVSVERAKLR